MDNVANLIKILAVNAVAAEKPSTITFGIAESANVVVIEQKLRLQREQLSFLRGAEFQTGDSVILIRVHGGQNYVVLGVMDN